MELQRTMKYWAGILMLVLFAGMSGFAAQEPEVVNRDGRISINVDDVTLTHLLSLWDEANHMQSSTPPGLGDRRLTLHVSGLTVNESVQRIFENQELDYVFIPGQGIIVTGVSESAAPTAEAEPSDQDEPQIVEQATTEPIPLPDPGRQETSVVPTPFGPIPNSSIPLVHLPPAFGEVLPSPFFAKKPRPTPPAGAANGPRENDLFGPISIYPN
jgi:hypothetical protein